MAGQLIVAYWARLRAVWPQRAAKTGWAPARRDLAGTLIDIADAVEAGLAGAWRAGLRGWRALATWLARRKAERARPRQARGMGLRTGLPAGLLWRALAAATGVGITATLVAALSVGSDEPAVAQVAPQAETAARPAVRDVRVQALPAAMDGSAWVEIARPVALFGLEASEAGRRTGYEARRSADGQRREDVLTFGAFEGETPFLGLTLRMRPASPEAEAAAGEGQPFLVSLVRDSAARALSVTRSGAVTTLETKFGPVETADIGMSDGEHIRACIGFRHGGAEAAFGFTGWWCAAPGRAAERTQLGCVIDRIELLSAGDDRGLRAAFAKLGQVRNAACTVQRVASSGHKASWLDPDGPPPDLRIPPRRPQQGR